MSQVEFKYLTKEERNKIPDGDFGYVKGLRRLFPITDASSVLDAARLIGRAKGLTDDEQEAVKKKIIKIAKRKGYKIPEAWAKKAKMSGGGTGGLVTISASDLTIE